MLFFCLVLSVPLCTIRPLFARPLDSSPPPKYNAGNGRYKRAYPAENKEAQRAPLSRNQPLQQYIQGNGLLKDDHRELWISVRRGVRGQKDPLYPCRQDRGLEELWRGRLWPPR